MGPQGSPLLLLTLLYPLIPLWAPTSLIFIRLSHLQPLPLTLTPLPPSIPPSLPPSGILVSSTTFFQNSGGWKPVKATIRHWQTESLKNKRKVLACLQPLSFRHAECDRSISLWCWLLLPQLLFFFFLLLSMWLQMGGKSAGLWDQAILLPWIENKDDSNKKENQLLFHSISTGKSGWEIKEIK